MPDAMKFYRKLWKLFGTGLLVLLMFAGLGYAQKRTTHQAPASAPASVETPASAQAPGGDARPPGAPPSAGEDAGTVHQITPQEAKELFRSVDEILKFASQDTALPIHSQVKRRLSSRDEVVAYITKHMAEDEDAQRLKRSELVLKKFGLLPRDFNLETFLIGLLREQVAGFYDPKTKTVNLLDWVDLEAQRPVLAHELTHALQDQGFGLEKWMKAGLSDLAEKKGAPTPEDIRSDEMTTARQAVVEGQAMVVLVDYMLAPTGQSMKDSPQIVEALKQGMLVGTADSLQFRNAPLYLKEALTFPYRYGLDFVGELLTRGGKEKAFASVFKDPPLSTRQIMEPATYLSGERLQDLRLPDFARVFKNYQRFDLGAFGEFDVAVWIDQFEGSGASHRLYPHWRGGYYFAGKLKGDPAAPLGLLYVSRWSNAERAAEFAAIYARSLAKRYQRAREAIPGAGKTPIAIAELETLSGNHTWLTEEGPVVIQVHGDTVMVTESLDPATTELLEHEMFAQPVVAGK